MARERKRRFRETLHADPRKYEVKKFQRPNETESKRVYDVWQLTSHECVYQTADSTQIIKSNLLSVERTWIRINFSHLFKIIFYLLQNAFTFVILRKTVYIQNNLLFIKNAVHLFWHEFRIKYSGRLKYLYLKIFTFFQTAGGCFANSFASQTSRQLFRAASSIYSVNRDCHCFRQGSHTNKVIITAGTSALRR